MIACSIVVDSSLPKGVAVQLALYLQLLFVAYLRPREGLRLLGCDVAPPLASLRYVAVNLHASEQETRSKLGLADESILLDANYATHLGPLLLRLAEVRQNEALFNFNYDLLKNEFVKAQVAVGLPERFVIYQCRHGGPSHDRAHKLRTPLEVQL